MGQGTGDTTHKLPGDYVLPLPPAGVLPLPDSPRLPSIPGYELRRELGRGGMGVVWEAWSLALGRAVALKAILPGLELDPELAARLDREVAAQGRLDHPNVVRVLDAGRHQALGWMALEYVPGDTLEDRLRRTGPLPAPLAARWARQLAEALAHAHALGVLHRDLKPANVLIDSDERPRLTDFGVARVEDQQRLTLSGVILGSPAYMPPEQARGNSAEVDARSDVYGLGAVLYEMLCGSPPYRASSQIAILEQLLTREPERLAGLNAGVDPGLEAICRRCMARAPDRRYGSAAELAAALARWQAGGARGRWRPWLVVGGLVGLGATSALLLLPGRGPPALPGPAPVTSATREPLASEQTPAEALRESLRGPPTQAALLEAVERARSLGLTEQATSRELEELLPEADERGRLLFAFRIAACEHDPAELLRPSLWLRRLAGDPGLGGPWRELADAILRSADRQAEVASELQQRLAATDPWRRVVSAALFELAGRPEEGLEQLRRAAADDPGSGWIPWFAAMSAVRSGRSAQGLEALARWDRQPPAEVPPAVLAVRAQLTWMEGAEELARVDMAAATRGLSHLPLWILSTRAHMRLALDPIGARRDLVEIGERRAYSAEEAFALGTAHTRLGAWVQGSLALMEGMKSAAIGPVAQLQAILDTARCQLELGRSEEVQRLLRLAERHELAPARGAAIARLRTELEELESLRADPLDPAATPEELERLLEQALAARQLRRARAAIDRLLELGPRTSGLLLRSAELYLAQEQFQHAARDLEQAGEAALPPQSLQDLALARARLGQWEGCLAPCEAALADSPDHAGLLLVHALALIETGRAAEGLAGLRTLRARAEPGLRPQVDVAIYRALLVLERWEEALELLRAAERGEWELELDAASLAARIRLLSSRVSPR